MAAPIMERQAEAAKALPLLATSGSDFIETGRHVVTDCPPDAWNESDQAAMLDLRNTFGDDLVEAYETALRRAAHWLIETHLRAEWHKRGFFVAFNNGANLGPDSDIYAAPADEIYREVWQAAADAITDHDLVLEASLGHVFQMSTDLERHRAALHHRLDEWASKDMCGQAEQQLDGIRAAVENAKTRAQLIAISESFA